MMAFLRDFLRLEAAGGIVLMVVAAAAMIIANSPLAHHYEALLARPLLVASVGTWINDGLMVLFFLLVGLEIKREMVAGELSTRSKAMLPVVAALGGIVTPALIYMHFNDGTNAMRGWAIPTATDIAFSLGVLSLLGSRVSTGLKVFLMALAIIDDLAAVGIIAVFYTNYLRVIALTAAFIFICMLVALRRMGEQRLLPYLLVGVGLWLSVLASGVHATVAGVVLAFFIPLRASGTSVGHTLIHRLHPWVTFCIVPLFAFANAGVKLDGISLEHLLSPVPLGIAAGLFIGKQLGIFVAAGLLIRLGLARLPAHASWLELYGVCIIAGIGFTMSLFIGTLAFSDVARQHDVRLGVMIGSLLSAITGYALLWYATRHKTERKESDESF